MSRASLVSLASFATFALLNSSAGSTAGSGPFKPPVRLESFAPLRTLLANEATGEPVIEVAKDGTIFVSGTCCSPVAAPVWRSRDGRTFSELATPLGAREWTVGGEGDIALDDQGGVYFVEASLAGLVLTKWSDNGESWDFTIPVAAAGTGWFDRPWLTWADDSLYLYLNHGLDVRVFRSDDGGLTWTNPAGPLEWNGTSESQPYFPGFMTASEDDVLVAGVARTTQSVVGVAAAWSRDRGASFKANLVTPWPSPAISPIFPGMSVIDERGNGYVVWSFDGLKGCDIYFAVTTNRGETWSEPRQVSNQGGCATFPAIATSGEGQLAIAWYQTSAVSASRGSVSAADSERANIYGSSTLVANATQDEVRESARWYLHAATVTRAHTAKWRTNRWRAVAEPVLSGPLERRLLDFFDIEIGVDGRIHIAYATHHEEDVAASWYVGSSPLSALGEK